MVNFTEVKERVSLPDALKMLGLQLTEKDGVYRGKCPACNTGGERALVVTTGKGAFCFAAKKGGDVIWLAAHIKGIEVKAAAEFLMGKEPTPQKEQVMSNGGTLKPLDYLDPKHEKVLEIVTEETARFVGMGYAPKGIMRGTVAVPLHDATGTLVAYVGLEEPYRLPTGFLRTQHIFNAHRITTGEVRLLSTVEDVLRAQDAGIDDAIAFLTTTIGAEQLKTLADLLETKDAFLVV